MDTSYSIALFFHVLGAFGLAIGSVGAIFGLLTWRRAQDVSQLFAIGRLLAVLDPLAIFGGLLALVTGLYMTAKGFTFTTGWIDTALGNFVLLGAVNGAIVQRQRRTVLTQAGQAASGPVPVAIAQLIRQPLLSVGMMMQLFLLVSILFLMTVQPDLPIALGAVAAALVVGGVAGALMRGPAANTGPATSTVQ
jgi:hypothetical protein